MGRHGAAHRDLVASTAGSDSFCRQRSVRCRGRVARTHRVLRNQYQCVHRPRHHSYSHRRSDLCDRAGTETYDAEIKAIAVKSTRPWTVQIEVEIEAMCMSGQKANWWRSIKRTKAKRTACRSTPSPIPSARNHRQPAGEGRCDRASAQRISPDRLHFPSRSRNLFFHRLPSALRRNDSRFFTSKQTTNGVYLIMQPHPLTICPNRTFNRFWIPSFRPAVLSNRAFRKKSANRGNRNRSSCPGTGGRIGLSFHRPTVGRPASRCRRQRRAHRADGQISSLVPGGYRVYFAGPAATGEA